MIKTTVYLETETAVALRELAKSKRRSQAELIREALEIYTRAAGWPKPKGVGKYGSGRSDISERSEALLQEAVKKGQ